MPFEWQRCVTWKRVALLMLLVICLAFVTFFVYHDQTSGDDDPSSTEVTQDREYHLKLVEAINNNSRIGWKARYNPSAHATAVKKTHRESLIEINGKLHLKAAERRKGIETEWAIIARHQRLLNSHSVTLPREFDARTRWAHCRMVHAAPDQGGCGSCWAMVITSMMQDRICIHTNGSHQPQVSAEDLVSCCAECGGCAGMEPDVATKPFQYWREHGLVTGGDYGSASGCKPYRKSSDCGHPCPQSFWKQERDGKCELTCQKFHGRDYGDDLYYGADDYWLMDTEQDKRFPKYPLDSDAWRRHREELWTLMKKELYLFGPFLLCFSVTEQYQHYASGVYEAKFDYPIIYGHCNKVLGWGPDETETDSYFLLMNTWGPSFGQHGFIKYKLHPWEHPAALAAMPDLKRLPQYDV